MARAPAAAALRRALEMAYSLLPLAVEVIVGRQSSLDCSGDPTIR